ncbi:alpha/beta hydrolase (plasmid) [Rhizobium sp. T1470]|uniref:alpha/beta hydrolase n=1 Tax=unclassified Rhizobium TaxID=2613769 RepID=UPI001AAF7383|nr:alpha/beta hydrolase [Rhizobium sp. T1473]MCA0805386.1 alpha/beta hydrolase [Rhizobium sp. T1473]
MNQTGMNSDEGKGRSASQPTVFGSHAGLFTPADNNAPKSDLAVLLLNPWGIEEMCTRRFYRILAERFAEVGVASLRFDYPGTVNSLDETSAERGLSVWSEVIGKAAEELKMLSGARNLVFIGQGIGASLALMQAHFEPSVAAIALLAPVLKGRAYLRELSLFSRLIDDGLGIKQELRDSAPGSIAGLRMPRAVAEDLKAVDLNGLEITIKPHAFMAERPGLEADTTFRDRLQAAGCQLRATPFAGYDALVSNPLNQEIPDALIDELIGWLQSLPQYQGRSTLPAKKPSPIASVSAGAIRETGVRFGPNDRLYGVLCEPTGHSIGVTAVILTTAYDHAAGWARSSVALARELASVGVSSLRFDSAGVGDSPPVAARRKQVLYDEAQIADAGMARDYVDSLGISERTLLIGRCGGAYVAFRSALADPRWDACMIVNPVAFRWRFKGLPKTLKAYMRNALDIETVRRLWAGDLDLTAVTKNISMRLVDRMAGGLSPVFAPAMPITQLTGHVHRDFQALANRGTPLSIIYTEGDEGQEMFRVNFGDAGEKLSAYPNVQLHLFPDADHNLTPLPARERMIELTKLQALSLVNRCHEQRAAHG